VQYRCSFEGKTDPVIALNLDQPDGSQLHSITYLQWVSCSMQIPLNVGQSSMQINIIFLQTGAHSSVRQSMKELHPWPW